MCVCFMLLLVEGSSSPASPFMKVTLNGLSYQGNMHMTVSYCVKHFWSNEY